MASLKISISRDLARLGRRFSASFQTHLHLEAVFPSPIASVRVKAPQEEYSLLNQNKIAGAVVAAM